MCFRRVGTNPRSGCVLSSIPCRYGEQWLSRPKGGLWCTEEKALQAQWGPWRTEVLALHTRQWGLRFVSALRGNGAAVHSGSLWRVGSQSTEVLRDVLEVTAPVTVRSCVFISVLFHIDVPVSVVRFG